MFGTEKTIKAREKINWKKDWPFLLPLAPPLLFCVTMPYFGLYQYLVPFDLHEWTGEHFKDFFRGLDRYSSDPLRDKVMFTWVTLIGFVWGVGYAPIVLWEVRQDKIELDSRFMLILFSLGVAGFIMLYRYWFFFHTRSSGKDFIYGHPINYIFCGMFAWGTVMFFIIFIVVGFYTSYKELFFK